MGVVSRWCFTVVWSRTEGVMELVCVCVGGWGAQEGSERLWSTPLKAKAKRLSKTT